MRAQSAAEKSVKITSGSFSYYSASFQYNLGVPTATCRQIIKTYMEELRKRGAKPLRDWDKEL